MNDQKLMALQKENEEWREANNDLDILADFRLRQWEDGMKKLDKAEHEVVNLQRALSTKQEIIDVLNKEIEAHRAARIDANDMAADLTRDIALLRARAAEGANLALEQAGRWRLLHRKTVRFGFQACADIFREIAVPEEDD